MMTYECDPDENIIHLRASGVLVRDDPISYFRELSKNDQLKPNAIEEVYFQELDDIAFSYRDIQQIRDAFIEVGHDKRLEYTVFITDSDLTFGMARMIISVFDHPTHDFRVEPSEE